MPMLISNPFNDHSRDFLVGNELGESYKVVRTVYDSLGTLTTISSDPKIQVLADHIEVIESVSQSMETIISVDSKLTPEILAAIPQVITNASKAEKAAQEAKSTLESITQKESHITSLEQQTAQSAAEVRQNASTVKTALAQLKSIQIDVSKKHSNVTAINASLSPKVAEVLEKHQEILQSAEQVSKTSIQVQNASQEVSALRDEVVAKEALVQSAVVEVALNKNVVEEKAQEVSSNTSQVVHKALEVSKNAKEVSSNVSKAKDWASKDSGQEVDGGLYSAKHYALEAKGYANQASQGQVQANWSDDDPDSKGHILNKPELKALALKDTIAEEDVAAGAITLGKLGPDVAAKLVEPSTFDELKADIISAITQAGVLE